MRKITRTTALAATALALTLGLAACGDDDSDAKSETTSSSTPMASETPSMTEEAMPASGAFGPGCDALPKSGPGSAAQMAGEPVATAASGSELLSTLVAAVTAADLGATLNEAEALTVFAPTNEAFAAVGKEALDDLLADKAALTKVLTHHVVAGQLGPDEVGGTHETLNGDTIEVQGSGEEWTVGDEMANVICGNVATKNATVYVIDKVLLP
jgi:uncharacterized surface protein with fasciclin (FAS1) repeats